MTSLFEKLAVLPYERDPYFDRFISSDYVGPSADNPSGYRKHVP